ncbi:MAG TPA: hypothetical protein VJH37_02885 [Candidatus Nanoarchaeia archaeon]|nr:hypothetical protein [Candidatus Nanoarchaeia archaeon]
MNYAKFLNVNRTCVQGYYYARYWHKGRRCTKYIPLWVLKKSVVFLSDTLKRKIKQNITSIRGRGGNQINELKLPFQECPAFYRVVAHLIGDGCDSHTPYYSNTCKELREQFKKDLQIFGKIKYYETRSTQNPNVLCVNFTKTLTHILRYILNIRFTHPDRVPTSIFNASEQCKKAFLQALFDDEGTISTVLAIGMKEERLIQEIKVLCKALNIQTSKTTFKEDDRCSGNFSFNIRSISILKFKKEIGFSHPEKVHKLEIRKRIIERNKIQRTRPLEWTRNELLKLLKETPMSTIELSEKLLLTMHGLYSHLAYLERNGSIRRTGYTNKIIWKLN